MTSGAGQETAAATASRGGRWRTLVATVLIALAGVTAPVAVVATWADNQVGDTERYVATVAPLASEPAVQTAVIDHLTTAIVERLDVTAATQRAVEGLAGTRLPPAALEGLSALAVPLAEQVHDLVETQVGRLVRSPQFEEAWIEANRQAHGQMVVLLTGEGTDAVATSRGAVRVNLAVVVNAVKQRLVDGGFELAARIPEVNAEFTVFESADLTRAQAGFRLLDRVSTVLPPLCLALLVGGVLTARSRRRAAVAGLLVLAGSMVALGVGLNVGRQYYLGALPSESLPLPAAAAVFDAVTHFLRLGLRSVLVVALVAAAITWVTGPGTQPSALRRTGGRAVGALRDGSASLGLDTGPVGAALHTHRSALRALVLGVAAAAYVLAAHPTGRYALTVLGIALLVLLVLEVLARPAPADESQAPSPSPGS